MSAASEPQATADEYGAPEDTCGPRQEPKQDLQAVTGDAPSAAPPQVGDVKRFPALSPFQICPSRCMLYQGCIIACILTCRQTRGQPRFCWPSRRLPSCRNASTHRLSSRDVTHQLRRFRLC